MPVLFRGNSEYDKNYRWNQSYRSASFSPNLEQSATDAGLRSDQIGSVNGARITSKKKVWHRSPQVQYCLSWWPENDADSHTIELDNHAKTPNDIRSPVIKAHKKLRSKEDSTAKPNSRQRCRIQNNASKQKDSTEVVVSRSSPKKSRTSVGESLVTRHEHTKEATPTTTQENRSLRGSRQKPKKKMDSPKKKQQRNVSHDNEPTTVANSVDTAHVERNIPLEHRARLNANKPIRKSKARLSEYQQNFAPPRFSIKPSPVLTALDVVHASSPAIPPHSGMQFHQASEYISKYGSPVKNRQQDELPLSPASPSLKLKVKDMQKPYFTHKSQKGYTSEYAAQYESNCQFEVGELRKIAEDNKQKHEGTHIDPEHATQVISPSNKLWEVSTDGGTEASETNATDDKETKVDQETVRENDSEEKWSKASQKGSDGIEDMTEEEKCTTNETDSLENEPSEISKPSTTRKLAWTEEAEHDELSQSSRDSVSVLEGRVSTPRLQEIGGALRTHHDLTTPSVGGALLISPKSAKKQPSSEDSSVTLEQLQPKTAGSPTYDSHSLLKGRLHHLVRSSPQPLPSKHSPDKRDSSLVKTAPSKNTTPRRSSKPSTQSPKIQRHTKTVSGSRVPIRGALRSEEFQHCGRLQTAPALIQQNDDDVLSIASSLTSARATELLQRAKQRKSFWTTT